MTNKAKTYLKNIKEADTEKKLIGIEIAFKQDMTLSCNDLGSLCRAAEDKRYSLRNNEETLKLKQILFFRTKAEMDAYHDMSRKPEGLDGSGDRAAEKPLLQRLAGHRGSGAGR